jgi:MoxR-like ATPase
MDQVGEVEGFVDRVVENIERVIIGKRRSIEYLLVALLSRGHVLIEDAPGTGAASIDLTFARLQCTPDLLPSDITGVTTYNRRTDEPEFRAGPIMANIVLADEINRATPRTQSALLEAMQEQ